MTGKPRVLDRTHRRAIRRALRRRDEGQLALDEAIQAAIDAGENPAAIARELGITPYAVRKRFRVRVRK